MAEVKFAKGSEEWQMFMDYWALCQKCWEPEETDEWWEEALGKIELPVPAIGEQNRIVALLDKFDGLCNDLNIGLPAEIEARKKQYEYYRDKLLTFKKQ